MANKTTRAVTEEEFRQIISAVKSGFIMENGKKVRPNERIAMALTLEANLGMRISDILQLKLKDIVFDGEHYHLKVVEQKTGKKRTFSVPLEIYSFIQKYAIDNGIKPTQRLCELTPRAVQNHLKMVCEYLHLEGNISSHSFRKFYGTKIFRANGDDILLVKKLLQHASIATSEKYLCLDEAKVEQAIQNHIYLPA